MVKDKGLLIDAVPHHSVIQVANGDKIKVESKGSISLFGKHFPALFAPALQYNLLSIKQLTESGFIAASRANGCGFKSTFVWKSL